MLITDDLIARVRENTDEFNTDNATDAHIINLLNEGQRKATNIVARKYDSMFLEFTTITTIAGTRTYDIPAKASGRRIEKVEVQQGSINWNLQQINHNKRDQYITSSQSQRPYYYMLRKNKIEIFPSPSAGLTLEIGYLERLEPLVVTQGRITSIDTSAGTVLVDTLGSGLSTTATSPGDGAYISIIDYTTGASKINLQVSATDSTLNQITFKSSGLTRSTVLGKTIGTAIGTDAAVDDYVSLITGTCVPELDNVYIDYLIQYASYKLKLRFGESTQEEYVNLKDLEIEIEKMWAGRALQHRVKKASGQWGNSLGSSTRRLLT